MFVRLQPALTLSRTCRPGKCTGVVVSSAGNIVAEFRRGTSGAAGEVSPVQSDAPSPGNAEELKAKKRAMILQTAGGPSKMRYIGFNLFCSDQLRGKPADLTAFRKLGHVWQGLSEAVKAPYERKARELTLENKIKMESALQALEKYPELKEIVLGEKLQRDKERKRRALEKQDEEFLNKLLVKIERQEEALVAKVREDFKHLADRTKMKIKKMQEEKASVEEKKLAATKALEKAKKLKERFDSLKSIKTKAVLDALKKS